MNKEELRQYSAKLLGEKEELQQRIDKAIEYIEKEMFMYDNIEAEREDLLKILKGEDE